MSKKRTILVCLVCMFLLLSGQSAFAATGGGAVTVPPGQADIYAGVVVDYMGTLRFLVRDQDTGAPIENASIEIYMPSLDHYVLCGLTDVDGILDLDVAYGGQSVHVAAASGRAVTNGKMIFLKDNNISYRAYKADYLPYPYEGSTVLKREQFPQITEIWLHKKKNGGGSGGNGGGSNGGGGTPGESLEQIPIDDMDVPLGQLEQGLNIAGGIPKTGVEGTAQYWFSGLFFFLIAGVILLYLMRHETSARDKKD